MAELDLPDITIDANSNQRNWDWLRTQLEGRVNTLVTAGVSSSGILKSLVDAKGDLITATANDIPVRQAVGADNTTLLADSAQTNGIKWGNKNSGFVTSLPGSPTTGDTCVYTDSLSAPTYAWQSIYNNALASNKWLFVGGSPMFSEVVTDENTTSTAYTTLTTAGPQLTVPLAGDYFVEFGAKTYHFGSCISYMSFAVGGTAASDNDAVTSQAAAGGYGWPGTRAVLKTGIAASTLLSMRYRVDASTGAYRNRHMRVTPRKVG